MLNTASRKTGYVLAALLGALVDWWSLWPHAPFPR